MYIVQSSNTKVYIDILSVGWFLSLAHVRGLSEHWIYLKNMISHLNIHIGWGDLRNATFAPSQFNQDTAVASGNRSDERTQWQSRFFLSQRAPYQVLVYFHFLNTLLRPSVWDWSRRNCGSKASTLVVFFLVVFQHPSFYLLERNRGMLDTFAHDTYTCYVLRTWCGPIFTIFLFFSFRIFLPMKWSFYASDEYIPNNSLNRWKASGQKQEIAIDFWNRFPSV